MKFYWTGTKKDQAGKEVVVPRKALAQVSIHGSNLDRNGGESRRDNGTKWKNQGRDEDLYIENRFSVTENNKLEAMKF